MKQNIRLFIILSLFCLVICALMFSASADSTAPSTEIAGHNLALEDNIQIVYYVDADAPDGAEQGVLFWFGPQTEYTYENAQYKRTSNQGTYTAGETTYLRYTFAELSAKMMTVDVYAVSYIKDGENIIYSDLDKYSVLQYAYNKKNSDAVLNGGTATLGEMVQSILNYGAMTQKYSNYNTDRLANDTYYQVSVVNGTFADGTASGLFQSGKTINLQAAATQDNMQFSHWKNNAGETVGTELDLSIEVTAKEEVYTAVYKAYKEYSEGLAFTSNGNGTCSVSGIGVCTDTDIIIPLTSPNGDAVTSIKSQAFYGCNNLTSIIVPNSVTSIGEGAFRGCSSLQSITLPFVGRRAESGYHQDTLGYLFGYTTVYDANKLHNGSSNDFINTRYGTQPAGTVWQWTCYSTPHDFGYYRATSYYYYIPSSLRSVTITGTIVSENAFFNCTMLTEIILADSVTSIEARAFKNCSGLTSVTIGNSVTNIGDSAFSGCSELTDIYYQGTEEEWNAITKASNWNSNTGDYTIHYNA